MNGITFPKHQTFAYRQSGMSLKSQLIQLTNEFGLVFARFGTAEYCEATLMVFRLGTKVDKDPGASSLPSVQTATLLNACRMLYTTPLVERKHPRILPYEPIIVQLPRQRLAARAYPHRP